MHKFAVIHKPSNVVCYSANRVNHCVAPNDNYQIVSLDSNANQFTTVACDLTFGSYSEIVASLSGEFIGFYTDADDTMFISNEFRTINIPVLLFNETCLELKEVVMGEICELVSDDEYLANKAVQLWVASRFLANDTTETTTDTTDSEMSTPEMSNVFKKPTTLPITITFAHSISKAREYAGCPRIVASCENLDFKASQVGYGYDMIGALMSDFINSNCTQHAIQYVFAFNELRGGYNPIRYNVKREEYRADFCTEDAVGFFDNVDMRVKFNYRKNGKLASAVIYK